MRSIVADQLEQFQYKEFCNTPEVTLVPVGKRQGAMSPFDDEGSTSIS